MLILYNFLYDITYLNQVLINAEERLKKDHRFQILILSRSPSSVVSFVLRMDMFVLRMDMLNTYFSENSLVDPKVQYSSSLESLCLCAFMEYVSSVDLHLCGGCSCLVYYNG